MNSFIKKVCTKIYFSNSTSLTFLLLKKFYIKKKIYSRIASKININLFRVHSVIVRFKKECLKLHFKKIYRQKKYF